MRRHIQHLDDERTHGHGWIVTLNWGRSFYETQHEAVKAFDTKAEALHESAQSYPCKCHECKSKTAE